MLLQGKKNFDPIIRKFIWSWKKRVDKCFWHFLGKISNPESSVHNGITRELVYFF
jgi:hypothetical protein